MIFVKPSTIANAGNGLFTDSFIEKYEEIAFMEGDEVDTTLLGADELLPYGIDVGDGRVLNCLPTHPGLAQFANDARDRTKTNAGFINDETNPNKVLLIAMRDIQPGEEIFADYGSKYWLD